MPLRRCGTRLTGRLFTGCSRCYAFASRLEVAHGGRGQTSADDSLPEERPESRDEPEIQMSQMSGDTDRQAGPAPERVGATAQRKIALRLLPVIGVGYGLAYMDRVNISFASLQMNQDLHFSATVYGVGAGLFFIGYALCE